MAMTRPKALTLRNEMSTKRTPTIVLRKSDAVGDGAEDKSVSGDFVHRQNVQRDEIQQQINSHDGENAAENCARNVTAWLADFLAKINDAIPTIDGVDHNLQAEHDRNSHGPSHRQGKR